MSVKIIWQDPPASALMSPREAIAAELKRHPGRWALVSSGLKSKTGVNLWKKLGLEAVPSSTGSTTEGNLRWDIYARAPESTAAQRAERAAATVTTQVATPEQAKKAPLVTQKVSKARDLPTQTPAPVGGAIGDPEAQARVKAQMAARMGHRRG
jgi:hypothetical protein